VKGAHEEFGFRLTCGLKRLLLHEGERGAIVPDGMHTPVAALVEFTGIFLPLSFPGWVNETTHYLFPFLQGGADALQGMAIVM
jgi:hypothetical protein